MYKIVPIIRESVFLNLWSIPLTVLLLERHLFVDLETNYCYVQSLISAILLGDNSSIDTTDKAIGR